MVIGDWWMVDGSLLDLVWGVVGTAVLGWVSGWLKNRFGSIAFQRRQALMNVFEFQCTSGKKCLAPIRCHRFFEFSNSAVTFLGVVRLLGCKTLNCIN